MKPSNSEDHLVKQKLNLQFPGIKIDDIQFDYLKSRKTGRIRSVLLNEERCFSLRTSDGRLLPTLKGAELILSKNYKDNCIIVNPIAVPFIQEGKSLYCKHVSKAGENIFPGATSIMLTEENELIAVGIATQPSKAMIELTNGIAVKIKFYKKLVA